MSLLKDKLETVKIDSADIKLVIIELLNNAQKSLTLGQIKVRAELRYNNLIQHTQLREAIVSLVRSGFIERINDTNRREYAYRSISHCVSDQVTESLDDQDHIVHEWHYHEQLILLRSNNTALKMRRNKKNRTTAEALTKLCPAILDIGYKIVYVREVIGGNNETNSYINDSLGDFSDIINLHCEFIAVNATDNHIIVGYNLAKNLISSKNQGKIVELKNKNKSIKYDVITYCSSRSQLVQSITLLVWPSLVWSSNKPDKIIRFDSLDTLIALS